MKLIPISDGSNILAGHLHNAEGDISWFVEQFNLKHLETTNDMARSLKQIGIKRMRLSKADEKMLGAFQKAEIYSDGIFKHGYLHFANATAILAEEEAFNSITLAYLKAIGVAEETFGADPVRYLALLGFKEQDGEYSLDEAGLEVSLKALHGKPKKVRRYVLADDYLFIAVFQNNTVVKFRNEEQLIRIWRDLGIIFSLPRFKATIEKLMGSSRRGQLQVLLANDQTATLTIDRDTPNWEGGLFAMCEKMGGGAKALRN